MKHKIVADLHNHSTASDGEYTPYELIAKAKEIGLKALSLTDHDTIKGLDEALEAASHYNLTFIPGVEASIRFRRSFFTGTLHLLIYFPTTLLKNDNFKILLNQILSEGRGPSLVNDRVKAINATFGITGPTPLLKRQLTILKKAISGTSVIKIEIESMTGKQ